MTSPEKHYTDIFACVGYVCSQWAMLEHVLLHSIFALTDTEYKQGEIQFGGLDMQPRANLAINLARYQKAPKHITARLVRIRKAIQDELADRRNLVVHGVHSDGDGPEFVKIRMPRWPEPKKRHQLTARDIQKIGDDINAVAREALIAFNDIGDWKFGGHRLEGGNSNV